MKRYETPAEVARVLASHAPRNFRSVLDPAVGNGALLTPLVDRFRRNGSRVVCLDFDSEALLELERDKELMNSGDIVRIHTDFLEWTNDEDGDGFDCIVMNPPFSGKNIHLQEWNWTWSGNSEINMRRYMPIEAAFLCKACYFLRDGGRLLCVLPCSVIMSESLRWIRKLLPKIGSIRSVHELPSRSFPRVESRMYLMVFEKGSKRRVVDLFNQDLGTHSRIRLAANQQESHERLDFSYHRAAEEIDLLRKRICYGWSRLGDLARVFRGDVESPIGMTRAVHTTDFVNGFWRGPDGGEMTKGFDEGRAAIDGDILVKRVARHLCSSFGLYVGESSMRCSDCVVILRPKNFDEAERLLFALRSLMELGWTHSLLERGTGARYITIGSLVDLWVPIELFEVFPIQFSYFVDALRNRAKSKMDDATKSVVECINYPIGE